MARKSWDELSPSYQKRLRGKGIGPREHAGGASIIAARGHASTPERNVWRRKALAKDIDKSLPGFASLPPAEAERLGKQWVLGFMSKSKGPLQKIKITDWRYGAKDAPDLVRYQTDEQVNARLEFLAWVNEHPEHEISSEGWAQYRQAYMESFSRKS
jgi:hypothetical protein